MNDDKNKLEEKNKEIDESKTYSEDKTEETKEEGSGIFTADGKELPKIDGGYDIISPDSGLGDNDYEG